MVHVPLHVSVRRAIAGAVVALTALGVAALPSAATSSVLTVDRQPSTTALTLLPEDIVGVGQGLEVGIEVDPAPSGGAFELTVDGVAFGEPAAITGPGPYVMLVASTALPEGDHEIAVAFSGDTGLLPSTGVVAFTVHSVNGAFARRQVRAVLGRDADEASATFWEHQLDGGLPREELVRRVALSSEGRARLVDQAYWRALGRRADGPGRAFWSARIAGGLAAEDLLAALIASAEGYRVAGSSPQGTAARLFQVHLGRTASPADLAHWTARLAAADTPGGRRAVALAFGRSAEAARVAVARAVLAGCGPDIGGGGHPALVSRWARWGRNPVRLVGSALWLLCPSARPHRP